MGNIKKTIYCTDFPEDKIHFDGHSDDDHVLVELWSYTDAGMEYNNISVSKKELIELVKQLEEDE